MHCKLEDGLLCYYDEYVEDPSDFRIFVLQRHPLTVYHNSPLVCIEVVILLMHLCLEISTGETWQSICVIGFVVTLTVIALRLPDSHTVLWKLEFMNIHSTQ